MKYGAHIYIFDERVDTPWVIDLIGRFAQLGLDFIEVPLGDNVRLDPPAIRDALARHGLELVTSPGGDWPMDRDVSSPDAAGRQAGVEWHKRCLEVSAACGALAYTGAIYGHPGQVRYTLDSRQDARRAVSGIAELADYAGERDLLLCLEPMSHFRSHVVNTPEQVLRLIAAADRPNLRVLFDTYHVSTEIPNYRQALETVLPLLWGLHACENHRGCPGTGHLPWDEITDTLIAHNWQGCVGFESYNSRCRDGAFAVSRGHFHDVCPDGEAFVRRAKQFMVDQFAAAQLPGHPSEGSQGLAT